MSQDAANTPRILVVEDEAMLRTLIETVLQLHGYAVYSAASGEEARQLWGQHRGQFDLVLADMVLPDGQDGYELATQFLAECPALKVLYASGFTAEDLGPSRQKLMASSNFLQKPYTTEALVKTVRQLLSAPQPATCMLNAA